MSLKPTYQPDLTITVTAAEELPAFRFVSHLGSICDTDLKSLGATDLKWNSGDKAGVITSGTALIESNDSITKGDDIASDSAGKAVKAGIGANINGRALNDAESGKLVKVLLVT